MSNILGPALATLRGMATDYAQSPAARNAMLACVVDDRIWNDAEAIADWLAGNCNDTPVQNVAQYLPTTHDGLDAMVENASVALLVVLMLHPRADVRAVSTNRLRDRYEAEAGELKRRITDQVMTEAAEG